MVVNGDDLLPNNTYSMKVWRDHRCRRLLRIDPVVFKNYTENGIIITNNSFDMLNLDHTKTQQAHLEDINGQPIILRVIHADRIWVTSTDNRVTFSHP